jgi:anti-sigma factor RsiW
MDCADARKLLRDHDAGRLDAEAHAAISAHLGGCEACRRAALADAELDGALGRLHRHRAPDALRERLEALVSAPAPARRPSPWLASFVSACAAAALVVVVLRLGAPRPTGGGGATAPGLPAELVTEVVNDHIRVVSSTHPIEIESGGIHQVKPLLTPRLEFAPRVAFSGDADFPLLGGSVGYVRDRKAAVFLFKRRLHAITLLVFPPEGLPWPSGDLGPIGRLQVAELAQRGFSVLLWRDGGLGYALISDVNRGDLEQLAARINPS